MANFMDLLKGQLTEGVIDTLTGQLGGANKDQTSSAAGLAMTTLMNAIAKNAQSEQGANALSSALERDHDGGMLDNVMDMLSGSGSTGNGKASDGFGILKHLVGDNIFNVVDMVSKGSGMNRSNAMSVLMKLAPVALGVLGKQKKQQSMGSGGLMDFLTQSQRGFNQQNKTSSLITRVLDRDGDGSAMDEIAGMGMKVLGGLFK